MQGRSRPHRAARASRAGRVVVATGAFVALAIAIACGDAGGDRAAAPVEIPRPSLHGLADADARDLAARFDALPDPATASGPDDAVEFGEAGIAFHGHGLLEAAEAAYANARILAPDTFRWAHYHGRALRDRGRLDDAAQALQDAARLDPADVPNRIQLGETLLDLGRLEEARAAFDAALDRDPASAAALEGLGRVALARKDFEAARDRLEAALALDPSADALRYPLGLAYRGLGEEDRALRELALRGERRAALDDPWADALRIRGGGVAALRERAVESGRAGRFDEAVALLREALAEDPDDPVTRSYLAIAVTESGRPAEGLALLETLLEDRPDDVRTRVHAGQVAAALGRDDRARVHLDAALAADPGDPVARRERARLHRRDGRTADAAADYAAAVAADPADGATRLERAFFLIGAGRFEDARAALEDDVRAMPGEPAFAHALARVLAAAPDAAARDGERAVALASGVAETLRSADVAETLAMAYAETGRFDDAVAWQQRAIDAARQFGRDDLLPGMQARREAYARAEPCRTPWSPDDPVLAGPAAGSGS